MSNKSVRNFGAILYPDADNYDCEYAINCIPYFFSEWAYVLHDKDIDEAGNLKKPHYHIALRKSTPSTFDIVARQLKVPVNYIQQVSSWQTYLQYLLHWNSPDKYQYPVDALYTNLPQKLFLSPDATAFSAYRSISECIERGECKSVTDLNNWCICNGYWSEFRRNWSLFKCLIEEKKHSDFEESLLDPYNPFLETFK